MRFIDLIPEPHRTWWREWGLDFDLSETRAECGACTMSRGAVRDGQTVAQRYDTSLKCCTFFPEIPNFTWAKISAKFETPHEGALTPSGLAPTPAYRERFAQGGFGERADLLCPFFAQGGCLIWNSRPSPCVRFVCQSSYGLQGQEVWEVVEALLKLTEDTLAYDALLRLGFTTDEIKSDGWFEFQPRELFARAGDIVAELSAAEVWDLLQPQAQELRDRLCAAAANALGSRS